MFNADAANGNVGPHVTTAAAAGTVRFRAARGEPAGGRMPRHAT